MPSDKVISKFGIQNISKGTQSILGAVMSKFGSTIDKRLTMSSLVSGKKGSVDTKAKFSRLGLTGKGVHDDIKQEQTTLMV